MILLWAALGAVAASAAGPTVDPIALLREATAPPAVPYYGRILDVQGAGPRATASVVQVFFKPPGMVRREFLVRGRVPTKVTVTNGDEEWLVLPHRRRAWKGEASAPPEGSLSEEAQWDLLQKNYVVAIKGETEVAGRKAWSAELRPKEPGKPRQMLAIDQATGLILRARKYHADGTLASMFKFVHVRVPADIPDDYFSFKAPEGFKVGSLPPSAAPSAGPQSPPPLPFGFQFEGADLVRADGRSIVHLRYTDGLVPLSFFESPDRVRVREVAVPGARIHQWRSKGRHFVVIGDLSRSLLKRLAAEFSKGTLQAPRP